MTSRHASPSDYSLENASAGAGSGSQIVTMMQTTEPWYRYDFATGARRFHWFSTGRRSLRQRKMRPAVVVVADVLVHEALQMALVEDDYVIEQIGR